MNQAKIFKRLKNGKDIELFHKASDDKVYTIRLGYKEELFTLHSYYFDGNDVFKESNYKAESLTTYSDFDMLIKTLQENFPGIEINF